MRRRMVSLTVRVLFMVQRVGVGASSRVDLVCGSPTGGPPPPARPTRINCRTRGDRLGVTRPRNVPDGHEALPFHHEIRYM